VPLTDESLIVLSEHIRRRPPTTITLPWGRPDAAATRTVRLLFVGGLGAVWRRDRFNRSVWHPALRAAGVTPSRPTGIHQLRHYFASVLIDGGASVKQVQMILGHASPTVTLDTYGHLFDDSDDRIRTIVSAKITRRCGPAADQGAVPGPVKG